MKLFSFLRKKKDIVQDSGVEKIRSDLQATNLLLSGATSELIAMKQEISALREENAKLKEQKESLEFDLEKLSSQMAMISSIIKGEKIKADADQDDQLYDKCSTSDIISGIAESVPYQVNNKNEENGFVKDIYYYNNLKD